MPAGYGMSEFKTHARYLKCDFFQHTDMLTALDYNIFQTDFYKWGKSIEIEVVYNFKESSYSLLRWCAFSFFMRHPPFMCGQILPFG